MRFRTWREAMALAVQLGVNRPGSRWRVRKLTGHQMVMARFADMGTYARLWVVVECSDGGS